MCFYSPYFNNKQKSPVYKNHSLQCTQFKCGVFKWNETKRTDHFLWWAQSINSLLLRLFYSNLWKFLFRWNFLSRLKWYLVSWGNITYTYSGFKICMQSDGWVLSKSVALNLQTISLELRNHGKFPWTHYLNKVQAAHYYFNRTFNSELFLECKLFSCGTLLFGSFVCIHSSDDTQLYRNRIDIFII